MSNITGILLAAGSSSRFGANKLLHPLPDGDAVAVTSARHLCDCLSQVIVVVRPDDQKLMDALSSLDIQVVTNPDASNGMSTSIASGIRAAGDADGWVIALADMPWVKTETIKALSDQLQQGASIVRPEYEARRGNPVGFSSRWKDELCALTGDKGARDLIESHSSEVTRISVNDEGILRDVDVPGDISPRI